MLCKVSSLILIFGCFECDRCLDGHLVNEQCSHNFTELSFLPTMIKIAMEMHVSGLITSSFVGSGIKVGPDEIIVGPV